MSFNSKGENKESCTKNFRLAVVYSSQGVRDTFEDGYRILPMLDEDLKEYSYFAIFDGHGGKEIVDFVQSRLEKGIAAELLSNEGNDIEAQIESAFFKTDMDSKALTTSGSTGVVALLSHTPGVEGETRRLVVANVGDSRAVLVSSRPVDKNTSDAISYEVRRLSVDHTAVSRSEQKRIVREGSFIERGRVAGRLIPSRCFGDHTIPGVSVEPHISVTNLNEEEQYMLILACDGVWDVISDEEAADMLMERFILSGPYENAAKALAESAISLGSRDNATAIVIFI